MKKFFNLNATQILFPKFVQVYNFERDFTKKEIELISRENNKLIANKSNHRSFNDQVLDLSGLEDIKHNIQRTIDDCLKNVYDPKEEISVYITQSWINYTNKGESHHLHLHANSFLSGVLYLQTDEDDSIIFEDLFKSGLRIDANSYNLFNSDSWLIPVKSKQLIIFPSNLFHSVPEKKTESERISLSFNTFLRGNLGIKSQLSELKLS